MIRWSRLDGVPNYKYKLISPVANATVSVKLRPRMCDQVYLAPTVTMRQPFHPAGQQMLRNMSPAFITQCSTTNEMFRTCSMGVVLCQIPHYLLALAAAF